MSDDEHHPGHELQRVPTGLPGLDIILRGGLLRGGLYVVHATPGCGKTILGNQVCFQHVQSGGRALFVTLLTESHSRMLSQLEDFKFFDPARVGAELLYVAGYDALEKDKLPGLLALLRQVIRNHKAGLLVIDGVVTAGTLAQSGAEMKEFIHELGVFADLVGCTTILLTGPSELRDQYAFRTMVDGILELHLDAVGMEAVRSILVPKFRGTAALLGRHIFDITHAGITFYPRTEGHRGRGLTRPDPRLSTPARFGVAGLDALIEGGLRSGSVSMVLGSPGSGKTLLGLKFLATGAEEREAGLYFGFFETPAELRRRGEAVGIRTGEPTTTDLIEIVWQSPLDAIADSLAEKVLRAVRERGVRRLFIDGLASFKDSLVYPERSRRFFTALFNELRSLGVITVVSDATRGVHDIEAAEHELTAMLDNVIVLRHVELRARLHKLVSVAKAREVAADPSVREYTINSDGFAVSNTSASAETILGELAGNGSVYRDTRHRGARTVRKRYRRPPR